MRVTIRDVAAAAGVHYTTVSRALNPDTAPLVNGKTRERVRRAAARLGYTPNALARGLRNNRTLTVGVVVPDITSPVVGAMVRGIEEHLQEFGYIALIANTDDDGDKERSRIDALTARGIDGLIVVSAHLESSELEEKLLADGLPLVYANRRRGDTRVCAVAGDDAVGIDKCVDHLLGLGHRRIAHVGGPLTTSTGTIRAGAFRTAMNERGLPVDEDLIAHASSYRIAEGARVAHELAQRASFTAVVAANDLLAIGVLDAARDRGLRCPDDISLTGFNDMPLVDKLSPALTTVRAPHYEIGAESARILLATMSGSIGLPRTALLPVELVVRESTTPPGT